MTSFLYAVLLAPAFVLSHPLAQPHPGLSDHAPERSLPEGVVSEWRLTPAYQLPGKAANLPGLSVAPRREEAPVIAHTEGAAPKLFGATATEYRAALASKSFPAGPFSFEWWIFDHVNQPVGAMAGVLDDNTKNGWFLGYYNDSFGLGVLPEVDAVATSVTVNAPKPWNGWWYHAVVTYDGTTLRLVVNGEERHALPAQELLLPNAPLAFWSYFENEPYMTLGNLVRFARLYDRPLSAEEIAGRFIAMQQEAEEGVLLPDTPHFTAGPILQMAQETSMRILWETYPESTGEVRFGTTLPLEELTNSSENKRLHEVSLEGLAPHIPYFYQVIARMEDGTTIDSGVLTFQTAPSSEDAYAFAVIADTESRPHINDKIVKAIWNERPNFVINGGDLTDSGKRPRRFEWTHEYLAATTQLFSRVPVFPVPGNGEGDLYWYAHYHSLPEPEGYYTYTYGNAQFFMLDSNRNMGPGTEQYQWLERELNASTASWKIVAHHHPPYTSDEDDYGNTWQGETSAHGDVRVQAVVPLYEEHGVDMVFYGHLHTYERSWPIKGGKIDLENGVVYVQTGGAGGNLEDAAPNRTWFMNRFHRGHHYCIVRIYQGTLELRSYSIDGHLFDSYTITQD